MIRILRTFFILSLLLGATLRAQTVHWEADDSALGNSLQLVFEDCEPDGDPQLPSIANATLTLAGRSSSVNIVNMSVSRTVLLGYSVQSRRGGPLQIPAFSVKTSKGPIRVAAFNGAAPTMSADSVATSKIVPEKLSVWAGEVFDVTYRISAARRNNPQFGQTLAFDWNPAPLVTEEWGKPNVAEAVVDGQRSIVVSASTRAYAKNASTLRLEAAHQVLHVQTGAVPFGLLVQPRMEPISITSDQPTIQVRPLPAGPADFAGAVGQFKLTSNVVPKEAAVGEPITWTLELSGTGNWPDLAGLPAREVSKDFQVIQPKAKRTPVEGKLFDATISEDVVLVPTKAGTYTLGPVGFTFFNPRTGAYETLRAARVSVHVSAAPAAGSATSVPSNTGPTAEPPAHRPATSPAAPIGIPRDPLPGAGNSVIPMTTAALAGWLLAPLGGLLLFWLGLAWRHAALADPARPRREARLRLSGILAEMRANPSRPHLDRLLAWQRDTAVLFGIRHAAPGPMALAGAASSDPLRTGSSKPTSLDGSRSAEWIALWREADRALYRSATPLPADWVARAEAALAARPVRGFNPLQLLRPRHLLAFAAALVMLSIVPLPLLADVAATGVSTDAAYRAGNFAAAEKDWRDRVGRNPTDWIARHNLSLALAQQDRHGEAAAQAFAAFVQQPGNPSVRWHASLALEKAGFTPAPMRAFLKEGPAASLAALASPGRWQRLLIGASFGIATALGWLLLNAYRSRSRRQAWGAGAVGIVALGLGMLSIFGVVTYGETADRRAVVTWQNGTLRSIPTEADTTQKMVALPAGSVAIMDKPFLGWVRLSFPNGQTGWVRKEEIVPLWR